MENLKPNRKLSNLDAWQLKQEKGKLINQIKEANITLSQTHDNYKHYFIKTTVRENEIRDHISNLDYINSNNIEKTKNDIQLIYDDITQNINFIEQKMKFEIDDTKKDIENRINIRLMDSEFTHKLLLDRKIKEQEGFMKILHSFTAEIVNIQLNYNKSKQQVIELQSKNIDLKDHIMKVNLAKSKLLKEMMNIKEVIFDIRQEIYLSQENKNVNENIKKIKSRAETAKTIKSTKTYMSYQNNTSLNKLTKTLEENKMKSTTSAISKLNNVLSSKKLDYLTLKKKKDELNNNKNTFKHAVYSIVERIKSENMNNNLISTDKNTQIYLDKDKRRRFVDYLTNNKSIINMINNCTVTLTNRKFNNGK
jgi:hypothetical protein